MTFADIPIGGRFRWTFDTMTLIKMGTRSFGGLGLDIERGQDPTQEVVACDFWGEDKEAAQ